MSAIKMRVLPLLPAQIVGIPPIFVEKVGNVYEVSYDPGNGATISMSQIIQQLSLLNVYDEIYAAIPANLDSPVRIAFNGNGLTQIGSVFTPGPVLAFIKTTLGWDTNQINVFLASALMLSY